MSLADRLAEPPEVHKGPLCSVRSAIAACSGEDAAALEVALGDSRWTHISIARALHAEGFRVSSSAISRHRKGECACEVAQP